MSGIRSWVFAAGVLMVGFWAAVWPARGQGIEEEVSFRSGEVTLYGTLLLPEGSEPGPGVVLVHGAGLGRREEVRPVAEAFVQEGFAALIYDKRREGYSSELLGSRSYALLAEDAIAAVQALRARDEVDADQVGVWGLSEGGWVAPLAASRSEDIAFVIAVAGGGVGPAEQTAWAMEGALRRQGVTSAGSLRALADHAFRFMVSAEMFAEGTYNPLPALEALQQPILALWGAEDRTMPAAASARRMQAALERGGHPHAVLRLIPGGSHDVAAVVDGRVGGDFAPGYIEMMASWIRDATAGNPPESSTGPLREEHATRPVLANLKGFARWEVQVGFLLAFTLLFGGYFVSGLARRFRRAAIHPAPGGWAARVAAALGLLVPWGMFAYIAFMTATAGEGVMAVAAGRPAGWLLLQVLAAVLALAAVRVGWIWLRRRDLRRGLVLAGGILFVPWAVWWQLFAV